MPSPTIPGRSISVVESTHMPYSLRDRRQFGTVPRSRQVAADATPSASSGGSGADDNMTMVRETQQGRSAGSSVPVIAVTADSHIGPRIDEDLRPYCPSAYLDEYD